VCGYQGRTCDSVGALHQTHRRLLGYRGGRLTVGRFRDRICRDLHTLILNGGAIIPMQSLGGYGVQPYYAFYECKMVARSVAVFRPWTSQEPRLLPTIRCLRGIRESKISLGHRPMQRWHVLSLPGSAGQSSPVGSESGRTNCGRYQSKDRSKGRSGCQWLPRREPATHSDIF